MDILDTGKFKIYPEDGHYIAVEFYSESEISAEYIKPVQEYFDAINAKVAIMILRESHYSLSPHIQTLLFEVGKNYFHAVAYVDKELIHKRMTEFAESTYLHDVPVKSFPDKESAAEWLKQFPGLPSND